MLFIWTAFQKLFAAFWFRLAPEVRVDTSNTANTDVISYLRRNSSERARWFLDYYIRTHYPATHSDLDEQIEKLEKRLPKKCRGTAFGYGVLIHPKTGVIFAVGSHLTFVLRLPVNVRLEALTSGASEVINFEGSRFPPYHPPSRFHASEFGMDWVFIDAWGTQNPTDGWVKAAYQYASELT